MDDKQNLKEPLKSKNPFDLPEDDEEDIEDNEYNQNTHINMNAKVNSNAPIIYVTPKNDLLTNKTKQIQFLRNFLTIYIVQIIIIGLALTGTLNQSAADFIYDNMWFCWVGIAVYFFLLIPVILGFTKNTISAIIILIGIDLSILMMVSQLTVRVGNPIGYICFVSVDCSLGILYLYAWLIDQNYNYFHVFCFSSLSSTIYLLVTFVVLDDHLWIILSYIAYNLINNLIITYACHIHLTDWMKGGDYHEDEFLHPGIRLHYDYIMLCLKKISDHSSS